MRKNRRKNRAIVSLILAALLAVEPAGAAMVVQASENPVSALQTETGVDDAKDRTGEDSASSEEDGTAADSGNTEENAAAQDSGNTETDGTDTGSGNTEEDNGTTDSGNTDDDTGANTDNTDGGGTGADSEHSDESDGGEDSANDGGIENDAEDTENPEEDLEEAENTADNEEDVEEAEELEDEEADTDEDERLEGFEQMPSNYRLTSEQIEGKRDLASHLDEISAFEEGVDYVDGQVITFAETQEEAEQIADAYHARIAAFEYGVLTLELDRQDTVSKAMRVAANEEINLPAVWPNYYRYAYEEIPEGALADGEQTALFEQDGAQEDTAEQDDFI